jgi:predicted ATPase/class 3 adenylate cyclase
VTFLFTDVEGSTRLWEQQPEAMRAALTWHHGVLRDAIEGAAGHVFQVVGDAFCAAFQQPADALRAAATAQRALHAAIWRPSAPPPAPLLERGLELRVRMALHTAQAEPFGESYLSPPLNRVARLLAAAHGGQVLLSGATAERIGDALPEGMSLRDLGERRLRDLAGTEHIYQLIVADLPAGFPPLRTLDPPPSNLPAQVTSFIGREQEVGALQQLLRRDDVRLVTLTGPGGTGKTRLGLAVAAGLLDEFLHGVTFVSLAAARDPKRVVPAIAHALGLKEASSEPLGESLEVVLAERQLLLLLDNFEQVLAAGPAVAALLTQAPHTKILVTSRERLNLYGEHEYPVPPLALPDLARLPAPAVLEGCASVALFVARARAVRLDFQLTADNAASVAEICVRLDGLPLALELAAASSNRLTPETMLARMLGAGSAAHPLSVGAVLPLLAGGPRDLPARQQTLRGAIAWSHDLLEPALRGLFARLAVFVGGCTLAAAEAVAGPGGDGPLADQLLALIEKNLLRQSETADGEPRFYMLESIREFAAERLAQIGEAESVRARHLDYFLGLAERAEPRLTGPEQAAWLARLEREHDNLRAALREALATDPAGRAARLADSLWRFWHTRSHFSEGRAWLEAVLRDAGTRLGDVQRARLLARAGSLARSGGDYGPAVAYLEESLALYRALGDQTGIASVLNGLGIAAYAQGDYARAAALQDENLVLARAGGDQRAIAIALINLGLCRLSQGDADAALALFQESEASFRALREPHGLGAALNNQALIAHERGDLAQACALYHESLAIAHELGNLDSIALNLKGLAGIAAALGQPLQAARLFGAEQALREGLRAPMRPSDRESYERLVAAARNQAEPTDFTAAWEEGRALDPDAAVVEALAVAAS